MRDSVQFTKTPKLYSLIKNLRFGLEPGYRYPSQHRGLGDFFGLVYVNFSTMMELDL